MASSSQSPAKAGGEVGNGSEQMQRLRVVPSLRQCLGDEGTEALTDMVFTAGQDWRNDLLELVENRFEIRLKSEISGLRVDVTRELAAMRVENLRWSFVFWITQLGAMTALLNYFK